ncbi:TauD/TfdA family dioxygenase [Rhodococcus sp. 14-2470-1b]|uniref:TauD/TfdA family dioxygenase n=1 Tax=Rhodococcus sp. 14-2470-1b TaxID=2023149 RepID=UPI00113FD30D|nr:TauD/TfdA family dioxygenase [Rhodococcus sp. 14-2470-1b]
MTNAAFDALDATALGERLLPVARERFLTHRAVRISNFAADVSAFIEFVEHWGRPLRYYAANTIGAHPDHAAIHHVRYEQAAAARGELHALDGPLSLHSAQTMRDPRPACFAMLMIDPGWLDGSPGQNGESIFVEWRAVLVELVLRFGRDGESMVRTLKSPILFPDGTRRSVLYDLPDAQGCFDHGVRMKYDLVEALRTGDTSDREAARALEALHEVAHDEAVVRQIRLGVNELVIIDNDRWAHGRRSVRGERPTTNGRLVNPRELWSVTLA